MHRTQHRLMTIIAAPSATLALGAALVLLVAGGGLVVSGRGARP